LKASYGPAFIVTVAGRTILLIADFDLWKVILRHPQTEKGVSDAFTDSVFKGFEPFITMKEAVSSQRDSSHMKALRSEIQNADNTQLMSERAQRCIVADIDADGFGGTTRSLTHFATRTLFRATIAALYGNALVGKLCDDDLMCADLVTFDRSMSERFKQIPRWASKAIRDSDLALKSVIQTLERLKNEPDERAAVMIGAGERIKQRIEQGDAEPIDALSSPVVLVWVAVVNSFGAMIYILWHLAHDTEMQRRVAAEVRAVLAEEKRADGLLSMAALARLPLVDSCISETLRRHGSGVSFRRTGTEPAESIVAKSTVAEGSALEVRNVPPKTEILAFNELFFKDPLRWANPGDWVGDRFVGSKEAHAAVEIVFGGGSHLCPGRHFVRNELRQVIASVLARFEITLASGCTTAPPAQADGFASVVPQPDIGQDAQLLFTRRP
jgi:cytochrome P450